MVKPFGKRLNHSSLAGLCVLALVGCLASAPAAPAALNPMEKKLSENPDDRDINLKFAAQAEVTGDLLRAEQYYLRAEALGVPQAEIVPAILRVLIAAHRYDEALARCQRRLGAEPSDRGTRFVAAALLVAVDRPKEAERELNTLVRSRPDDAQAYLALGRLYKDHDPERAREMFEKYLSLAPNGEAAAAIRFELAAPAPVAPPAKEDGK
jgi:predicted Zn-dependent protease